MDQNLLRNIVNELQAILPDKPVEKMMALYMDFARMETPVEQGVRSDWMDNVVFFYQMSDTMRAAHKNLLNPESFFKKMLYVVDEAGYYEMAANPKLGLYTALSKLGMLRGFPANVHLDNFDISRTDDPVCKAVAQTYKLRNNASHTSENWTFSQMIATVNAVMVATMCAVWYNKRAIESRVSAATSNEQYNIDALLKNLIQSYNKKTRDGFCYVSLLWESSGDNKAKQIALKELLADKQVLLSGDAGCGKSTALDRLEYLAAQEYMKGETGMIPVKLALINENPSHSLQEMICLKLNIPMDYCESLLERKDLLLLIDGLNELTTDAECKRKFVIALEKFVRRYPDVKMVVTDRRYSPFPIRLEKTYHLKTMKKEDILRYAKTRSECTEDVLALLTVLLDKPSFADLEYTPLLINQLLLALRTHHKLPEDLSELIGIYLEALQAREYYEKRDLNAAPGKLDLFLMKLATEDPQEKGHNLLRAMKLCAEIMQEYGVQLQSDVCINLAVQLGILQLTDGYVDFILDEYRSYYFIKAMDANI